MPFSRVGAVQFSSVFLVNEHGYLRVCAEEAGRAALHVCFLPFPTKFCPHTQFLERSRTDKYVCILVNTSGPSISRMGLVHFWEVFGTALDNFLSLDVCVDHHSPRVDGSGGNCFFYACCILVR